VVVASASTTLVSSLTVFWMLKAAPILRVLVVETLVETLSSNWVVVTSWRVMLYAVRNIFLTA